MEPFWLHTLGQENGTTSAFVATTRNTRIQGSGTRSLQLGPFWLEAVALYVSC